MDAESDEDDSGMDLDMAVDMEGSSDEGSEDEEPAKFIPMPASGGAQELRDKLHARMASIRRGGPRWYADANGEEEAGSRDELLEERRRQRAQMREKRRKETREKIRREEEARGKKGKEKERAQGPTTKVSCYQYSRDSYAETWPIATTACTRSIIWLWFETGTRIRQCCVRYSRIE